MCFDSKQRLCWMLVKKTRLRGIAKAEMDLELALHKCSSAVCNNNVGLFPNRTGMLLLLRPGSDTRNLLLIKIVSNFIALSECLVRLPLSIHVELYSSFFCL